MKQTTHRTFASIITLIALMFALAGCVGLAHVKVEMPPLVVQGLLLDNKMLPIASQQLTVILPDFYGTEKSINNLVSGTLREDDLGYTMQRVQTGQNGEFFVRLPGESRYIGFMAPLQSPSTDTLRSFVVGVRTASGKVAAFTVSGRSVTVRVPIGEKGELGVPPDNYSLKASAAASRSNALDVLQIVMEVHHDGA